jgi:putative membrane protein
MKRAILGLGLVIAAAAGAQTVQAPSTANVPAENPAGAAATAQKRIERDGYTNIQNLAKGEDGLWRGTAQRDGTQVQVTVDRSGNVTVQ